MNKFYKASQIRINIIISAIIFIWSVIFIQLFSLQIINHNEANYKLTNNIASFVTLKGHRGLILDKNSIPLSQNINKYTIWINSNSEINTNKNKMLIAYELSKVFKKSSKYYIDKMSKNGNYIQLEKNVSQQDIKKLKGLTGLNIDQKISRYYPYSELASQLIGYTDGKNNGKIGIEAKFNHILSGQEHKDYFATKGAVYNVLIGSNFKPENGANITLTIDINIQTILQDELNIAIERTGAKSANGVIVDPFTGNILAMSSIPSLDLNNYNSFSIDSQRNRVITDIYEPGSTYKVVTMAGKLELINDYNQNIYFCENGEFLYYDKIFHDHEKHADLSLTEILSQSSNIGMVKIASEIGKKNIYKFSREFGFGSSTGIPLIGESYGILRPINKWSGISAPEIAIGQEIAINNLQLAMAYCAIANGGFLLKPNIIDNIQFTKNKQYKTETQVVRQSISNSTSTKLLAMLKNAIIDGTGNYAHIKGFDIAGKTGTAQKVENGKYSKENYVSSFAAIYPSYEPKYVCIISIDSANSNKGYHWAGISVAPAVKNIFERIIHLETSNFQNLYSYNNNINTNSILN